MCSRSLLLLLLLLCALAFVEVSSLPTPRLPLIEDGIDLKKCVATRKGNNEYKCLVKSTRDKDYDCIKDTQFVQANTSWRTPPPTFDYWSNGCTYGFTFRHVSSSVPTLEIETRFSGNGNEFFLFKLYPITGEPLLIQDDYFSSGPSLEQVVPKPERRYNYEFVKDADPIFRAELIKSDARKLYSRFRFVLFKPTNTLKKFSDFKFLEVLSMNNNIESTRDWIVGRIGLECSNCRPDDMLIMNPCGQMMQMVYRKKSVPGWSHLTKTPREAFHHNVNDFREMCNHLPRYNQPDQVFHPYHVETGLEIVAIECLPEHENDKTLLAPRIPYAILRHLNGSLIQYNKFTNKYRDAKKVNYQFVEVTCRAKEEICFYCGEPEWNKDTASIPRGLAPMIYTAGRNDSCATLTCPDDSLPYYPHIRFTSLEQPQCEHNAEKDEFEWTFSYQPTTQWARVRRPLERGYCRKKSNCPPFTETMLACPDTTDHMPWFKGCVPVNRTDYSDYEVAPGYWCANKTKQFYFAFSRRIVQKPAIGVTCNENTGLYEVYLPDGEIQTGFTEESWIVCRDKPVHKVDKYWYFELDKYMKIAVGTIVGILLPVLLSSLFVAGYVPIKKILKKQKEETLQPEQIKAQAMEAEMAQKAVARKKAKDTLEYRDTDADYLKAVAAREEAAKRMKEMQFVEIDHNEDMRTCRLPTRSEQEMLDEIERQAKCTDEEDQTGREVKPIAREDEPEREEPDRRR